MNFVIVRFHLPVMCTVLLAALLSQGCVAPVDEADDAIGDTSQLLTHEQVRNSLRRVVIARMYQHDDWTLPAADVYRPDLYADVIDRRVHYVCDAIAPLQPTFVSGLVRVDATETLNAEQIAVFKGVRRCIRARSHHERPVQFDVVLNALHYADPDFVANADAGRQLIRARLRSLDDAVHPDAWFFDFYTVPFNKSDKDYLPEAMRAGMRWIHEHGQLVGGNVWGRNVPTGTDYVALPNTGNWRDQLTSLRNKGDVPVMMHIQNDPQIPDSKGLAFIASERAERKQTVRRHAEMQEELGFGYMYPVFFPMWFEQIGGKRYSFSYDAAQDGNMLERMKAHMAQNHSQP